MNSRTVDQLVTINRQFYQSCAQSFSQTRQRVQPGVRRILDDYVTPLQEVSLLDVGCGNADILPALAESQFRGAYTGIDFSTDLMRESRFESDFFTVDFFERDLTRPDWSSELRIGECDFVFCFAALHHIPGREARVALLRQVQKLLRPDGLFAFSVWQFQRSVRLARRIQAWDTVEIDQSELDEGDYLLDWRATGQGSAALRYVHVYSGEELAALAGACGFRCVEMFTSDGKEGNLSDYQVWVRG